MSTSVRQIGLPAQQHFKQVSGIVREPVDIRVSGLQPPGQEVGPRPIWPSGRRRSTKSLDGAADNLHVLVAKADRGDLQNALIDGTLIKEDRGA
jgi:hypothetical protein